MGVPDANGLLACLLFIYREAATKLQRVQILACVKGVYSARVSCGGASDAWCSRFACEYAKRFVILCQFFICETGGRQAFDQAVLPLSSIDCDARRERSARLHHVAYFGEARIRGGPDLHQVDRKCRVECVVVERQALDRATA
ncbi:hypothetical protein [Paraburkholderia dipogonis]|nr:hypothetical protein [Paraburkholderia dipogonis]